jgi:diguanylate cyclase (GGDEF)-like protein
MNEHLLSDSLLLTWHQWASPLAIGLLVLLCAYAVLQYAVAGSGGRASRFLNGGSLRNGMIVGIVLVGVVPAVALGLLLTERAAELRQARMADLLQETARLVSRVVNITIDKHVAGVSGAAAAVSAAGAFDREALAGMLAIYHRTYGDFLTMLATDAEGNIVTATAIYDGEPTPVSNLPLHNVQDRRYFSQPRDSGLPFISRVFQGRGLGQDPIVAVSAPMYDADGNFAGVLEGSLNLRAFARTDQYRPQLDGAEMILTDQDSRVIYSSAGTGFSELESILGNPLLTSATDATSGHAYTYRAIADGEQHAFMGVYSATNIGWRLYFRLPLGNVMRQVSVEYAIGGLLLLAAIFASMLLAGGTVRRVTRSVGDMNRAMAKFRVDGTGERVRTPRNTPAEFVPIFRQMRERSESLRKAYARLAKSIDAGQNLQRTLTKTLTEKEVEIAERTAELRESNKRLSELSKIDELTQIPNRREFEAFERRMWRLGARESVPVAIIMLDVDYFKQYNDALGHQAGDECLRLVASAIRQCATRPLDLVARYGGEEFVAVLGGAESWEALIVASRMRNAVEALRLPHPTSPSEVVTISVGVASAQPEPNTDARSLVKAADEALYHAKGAGRNCVVYPDAGEYVVYDADTQDTSATNVIAMLAERSPG